MSPARPSSRRCAALIVAGGRGSRAGGGLPKQYRRLAGVPVLRRTVQALLGHAGINGALVVIHPDDEALYRDAVVGLDLPEPVLGGDTRQRSVLNGLRALRRRFEEDDVVFIQDAARPLLSPVLLDRCVAAAAAPGPLAFVPALPVVDSLRRGNTQLLEAIDRIDLLRVQTPQCFQLALILAAHEQVADLEGEFTDDAAIAMAGGHAVGIIDGEERNFKLTAHEDFDRAEALLARSVSVRTGMGFDVHAFEPGDHVWIGGIQIAHGKSLKGHSDADVALHALTDAILGGMSAGDIGDHFPPSDPKWRGAPSSLFLEHARALVEQGGGRIEHVDVTIICEAPRIGPHRAAMRARIGELLRLPHERVSVKATTTERLGFTGRGEGIAAQAIATISVGDQP